TTGVPATPGTESNASPSLVSVSLALSGRVLGPGADEDVEVAVVGRDRDRRRLLERLQRRVHEVREPLEDRDVGRGREHAAGEDDLEPPHAVGEPAEDDEEGRADDQRRADDDVDGLVVELQRVAEEEESPELAGVPDHALPGGGAEERERDVLVVGRAE